MDPTPVWAFVDTIFHMFAWLWVVPAAVIVGTAAHVIVASRQGWLRRATTFAFPAPHARLAWNEDEPTPERSRGSVVPTRHDRMAVAGTG